MTVLRQCPICKRPVVATKSLPFCSEQCRLVDLGRWLGEDYRVAGAPVEASDEAVPRAADAPEPDAHGATGTSGPSADETDPVDG